MNVAIEEDRLTVNQIVVKSDVEKSRSEAIWK